MDTVLIPILQMKKVRLNLGQGERLAPGSQSLKVEPSLELKPPDSQSQLMVMVASPLP